MRTPIQAAQAQLDAYNARDLDQFASIYHPHVVLYQLSTGTPFCTGIEELRTRYGRQFAEHPHLHCDLVHRSACGNMVIDEEHVRGLSGDEVVHAIAVYEVLEGLIAKAWFIK